MIVGDFVKALPAAVMWAGFAALVAGGYALGYLHGMAQ